MCVLPSPTSAYVGHVAGDRFEGIATVCVGALDQSANLVQETLAQQAKGKS